METLFKAKTFFIISVLFIIYATTIPWDIAHPPSLTNISLTPGWDTDRGRIASIPDMVQNVILFLPLGCFAAFAFSGMIKRGILFCALGSGAIGFSLSLMVECLQTMSVTRTPSATDLLTNFSGALLGGTFAAIYILWFHKKIDHSLNDTLKERPGLIIFLLFFIAVLADSLSPFIPSLDIGVLRQNVRAFINNPWGPKPLKGLLPDILLFASFSFLAIQELPAYLASKNIPLFSGKSKLPGIIFITAFFLPGLIICLEFAQIIIIGHSPGVQDAVIGIFAVIVGGALSAYLIRFGLTPSTKLGETTNKFPWLVIAFVLLAPTFRALYPYELIPISEAISVISIWNLVPFSNFFQNINISTFYNVFEASAIYLPLGYSLHALGKSPRFGLISCFTFAMLLEILQIPILDRSFDITEGVFAGFMGLVGAYAFNKLSKKSLNTV